MNGEKCHMGKKGYLLTDREKLEALVHEAGLTKTQIAKHLEVTYRTVHQWMSESVSPHPSASREIDELFKSHVSVFPLVEAAKKESDNPIKRLREDGALRERFILLSTYHSNAIEGSRMTIQETELAIQGKSVRG